MSKDSVRVTSISEVPIDLGNLRTAVAEALESSYGAQQGNRISRMRSRTQNACIPNNQEHSGKTSGGPLACQLTRQKRMNHCPSTYRAYLGSITSDSFLQKTDLQIRSLHPPPTPSEPWSHLPENMRQWQQPPIQTA